RRRAGGQPERRRQLRARHGPVLPRPVPRRLQPVMSEPRDNPDRGERFDPRELLRIASVHRWLIAAVTTVVVGIAGLLTFTATPYYRAKARVLIERAGSN